MPTPNDETADPTEVDRDEQPERDDLVDPEDVDPTPVDEPTQDEDVGILPDPEELPESQGWNVLEAEREAEDASPRRLLSDEEAEEEDRA